MFSIVIFNLHILFKSKYGRRFRKKSISTKKAPVFELPYFIVYSGDYFGTIYIKEHISTLTGGKKAPP
jgi:hypothetical protein